MNEAKHEDEVRETMTTAQVANRLGISVASVRRRVDSGALAATWTFAGEARRDVNGNKLRGHRRVFTDSVVAYEKRMREAAESAREDG